MPSLKKNNDGSPHIHEYVRVQDPPDREVRYRCAHPDCTHFAARQLIAGKRTICAKCHLTETRMDYENMRRALPLCFKCSKSKKSLALQNKYEVLDELFGDGSPGVGGGGM